MKFDYLYFLSFMVFFICFISLGSIALRSFKDRFAYVPKNYYKFQKTKPLNYNIYLYIIDYTTYEKDQIWRFYFPA